jgi:hypothetical protein
MKNKLKKFFKSLRKQLVYQWKYFLYHTYYPWLAQHENNWFIRVLYRSKLFPWYGKNVKLVKSKTNLTCTEADIKSAIKKGNYSLALELIDGLKDNSNRKALKAMLLNKVNNT